MVDSTGMDDPRIQVEGGPSGPVPAAALIWVPVVALVYARSLGGEFLNWDDLDWIVTNPVVNGDAPAAEAWTGFVLHAYYPIYATALRLLWSLGEEPLPFHVASIAGFAVAAALWHVCLARMGIGAAGRWAGVAVFALHPLRVETVAWASALRDVLSLDLILLTLWLHLRSTRLRWAGGVVFVAALLCKTTVFALAPLPLLVDLLWRRRPWRASLTAAIPYLVAGAAGACVTWLAYRPVAELNVRPAGGLLESIPVLAAIQLRYLRLQLWPADLAALPSAPAGGTLGWIVLAAGAAIAAAAMIGAWRGRRGPALLLAAYALPMLPVCGLLPLSWPVADRYTLLPSLALSAAVAWFAQRFLSGEGRAPAAVALTAALALPLVVLVQLQIPVWHDSATLWASSLDHHPRESAAHQNYAAAVGASGDMDEAVFHLTLALELAGDREPQAQRLVQLLLFAELLRLNVPMDRIDPFLREYGACGTDGECLGELAVGLAASRLAVPSEVVARRAADLGAPANLVWMARATYEARDGRWWSALGYTGRGLQSDPADPHLLFLQAMALFELGGREAARPTAESIAGSTGMPADEVLDELERRTGS